MTDRHPSVLVGMSGGVDSSVSAALLVKRGYRVVGGFIKNWSDSKDLWTGECEWRGERRDAMRVAAQLGIPLLTFDFESVYRARVVQPMFDGYAAGETPNPDVLCNEMIKFGLFFEEAQRRGFDFVATGHYARIRRDPRGVAHLLRGRDPDKDQSYFLYRVPQSVLKQVMFPIGHLKKTEVRHIAKREKLSVAHKPDSQGICFIGKLDMKTFLRKKIAPTRGQIVDPNGRVLGFHEGLDAYTIGQRQRIEVNTGGHAWYVAQKNVKTNQLVIVPSSEHPLLYQSEAIIQDLHWTRGQAPSLPATVVVQVRYRQHAIIGQIHRDTRDRIHVQFQEPVKAIAPGQSAVLYHGQECLGGGVLL